MTSKQVKLLPPYSSLTLIPGKHINNGKSQSKRLTDFEVEVIFREVTGI